MSVYKPAKSRFWQYDFVISGKRFHGSTGQTSPRAAQAVERKKRLEAGLGSLGAVAKMTLNNAVGQYWAEKGIERGDAEDVERRLERLVLIIGPNVQLGDIDQVVVSAAVQTRKRQTMTRSPKKGSPVYKPSPATVNRDVIDTLRPVLRRARTHWSPQGAPHGLPEIDWSELRLTEPRPLSRLYTPAERLSWVAACCDEVRLALELILTYGLRFGEVFFPLDAFKDDPKEPTLVLQKGRKKDVLLYVPLRLDHARDLAARVCRARAAKLDHVWYFEGPRGLESLTAYQVEGRLSKAADLAGVSGKRRIHGGRHHAGNTVLRRSGGNLKAVQGLLGHASITSSQRYASVLTSELRTYVEDDVSRNSPEPATPTPPKEQAG
jgi:integrase